MLNKTQREIRQAVNRLTASRDRVTEACQIIADAGEDFAISERTQDTLYNIAGARHALLWVLIGDSDFDEWLDETEKRMSELMDVVLEEFKG